MFLKNEKTENMKGGNLAQKLPFIIDKMLDLCIII